MARNTKKIENRSINRIKEFFFDVEEKHNIKIETSIEANDKTPITDGFIRICDKDIAIQVKGKFEYTNTLNIDIQYYKYAKNNLLLFLYCDNTGDKYCENIYYEFFSIEFLEKKLKGKSTQKSISHTFTKMLKLETSQKFLEMFEDEFRNRDVKKNLKVSEFLSTSISPNENFELNGTLNYNPEIFQKEIEFVPSKATSNDTSIEYNLIPEKSSKFHLLSTKSKRHLEFDTKQIQYMLITNPMGDVRVVFNNFEFIVLKHKEQILTKLYSISYAKDINIRELSFLSSILEESDCPEALRLRTLELIDIGKKFEEVKIKYMELDQLATNDVEKVYNILNSNERSKILFLSSFSSLHTFVWTDNKYQLLDSNCKYCIAIGDDREEAIIVPGFLAPFFSFNPSGDCKYNQSSYALTKEKLTIYIQDVINGITEKLLPLIDNFVMNAICCIDHNLIDIELVDSIQEKLSEFADEKNAESLEVLCLLLKSILENLDISEKSKLFSLLSIYTDFESKIIIMAALGEKDELKKLDQKFKNYNGKHTGITKYIYNNYVAQKMRE